ncbi:MAG: carbon-nitrogen hydrolase family protein [Bacteroidia bacterium]|nr:carbon-nitrogen hydrolase family protein [Bacteroidia bacterium]
MARIKWLIAAAFGVGILLLGYMGLIRKSSCDILPKDSAPLRIEEIGSDSSKGASLIGIQPFLRPNDYACEAHFRARLASYLEAARQKGFLTRRTVVVFPEYIGTWLILLGEPALGFQAKTLKGALTWFVLRHPWKFWKAYQKAIEDTLSDPASGAAFQVKAVEMAQAYHRTFSSLAREYGVTVVAGSIVLPGAYIQRDSLYVTPGAPLSNISVVYHPDGRPDPGIVRKAFPIATELGFTLPGKVHELPTFQTPLGRVGVLICADSWFPESYRAIGKVDIVVVPSYLMGDSCWSLPWRGYSGWPSPPDVQTKALSEGEAWLTYAMGGRLPLHDSTATGLNVFLKGDFWELGADGRAVVVRNGRTYAIDTDIICIWMPPLEGKRSL